MDYQDERIISNYEFKNALAYEDLDGFTIFDTISGDAIVSPSRYYQVKFINGRARKEDKDAS